MRIRTASSFEGSRARVRKPLDDVASPSSMLCRSILELSGGQRQRVAIARALAPDLVVCYEWPRRSTCSCRIRTLRLLGDLRKEYG